MKFLHLSDLHLGKRVNEYSMLEDQQYILKQILGVLDKEKPEAVVIAGDVYDKPVPSAEAVTLLDCFLRELINRDLAVLMISGNHDSPERLSFGADLLERSGLYLSRVYDGQVKKVTLTDAYGAVNFYLLPFIKPVHVNRFYPLSEGTYTEAMRTALAHVDRDDSERNVLITHQFVTGAERSDSEEICVGGSDNVDASVFEGFDYTALGHIHRGQNVGSKRVRYCGTPLKYSLSEAGHKKSVTMVTLGAKEDEPIVEEIALKPLHDMRECKGLYADLTKVPAGSHIVSEDYVGIVLTDEEEQPGIMGNLRVFYPNMMKFSYDNKRTRHQEKLTDCEEPQKKDPMELFSEFYRKQNGEAMSDEQKKVVMNVIAQLFGGEENV